jgi:hypothetical protein
LALDYCNEKSSSAKAREKEANKKFNDVRDKVGAVLLEKSKVNNCSPFIIDCIKAA